MIFITVKTDVGRLYALCSNLIGSGGTEKQECKSPPPPTRIFLRRAFCALQFAKSAYLGISLSKTVGILADCAALM
jgi:hypothetical protein